jgi:hypothetical protein
MQAFWSMTRNVVLRTPLRRRLLFVPPLNVGPEQRERFAALAERLVAAGGSEVEYELPYPKHEFTRFLVAHERVLLHGTRDQGIEIFRPRPQTDFDGTRVEAVFATSDGIWPLFFAVVDRRRIGATRNVCLHARGASYYYFSVDADPADMWRSGTLYVLPREQFRPHADGTEWTSPEAVRPLARLRVDPDDFPFRNRVFRFRPGEPLARTLFRVRPGTLS